MRYSDRITRPLTLKYVFALGLLAVLAITNFLLLRTEILGSQAMASILNNSGRQRMLLQRTATLSERLVAAADPAARSPLRRELTAAIELLEGTHFELKLPDSRQDVPPHEPIRAIYEDVPWLLDSEMRNYVSHLRSLTKEPDDALHDRNAYFKYVRNPETIDKILNGLDAVVGVYEQRSAAKTAQLRRLAMWSLASTLVVLVLDGWFVFRPMVRRVREDVDDLNQWNATLDKRVAERAAEAERRAEQLAQSQSALRDSEALYRSLVNSLPMCVLRKDAQGRFTFANDEFCQLVGRPLERIVGCTDDRLYPPDLAAKYRADDQQVMETGRVLQDVERHRAPDGRDIDVEVVKAPLRDAAGSVIGTQTVFWDVTDRKQAEQRARHAERLAAIGQMVAGVAHESRNALQQVQACSRLLEWELDGDESKRDLIADLQTAQDRLHRLFDDLRGYASPLKPDVRPCNMNALLVQAWASVMPIRQGRDASLQDASADASLECLADPFHLEQVFRNVLENALAACRDPVVIHVEYHELQVKDSTVVRMTIRDNGPGLTREQQQHIFEPFFTTKTQGTGLGMAIVKQIVEAHGGTIEARSVNQERSSILGNGPGRVAQQLDLSHGSTAPFSTGTEIVITLPSTRGWSPPSQEFVEEFYA